MSEPRVSDEQIEHHLNIGLNGPNPEKVRCKTSFVLDLLQDLKDARAQLQHQATLRDTLNKDPE